jgi:importin subunit alpha-1
MTHINYFFFSLKADMDGDQLQQALQAIFEDDRKTQIEAVRTIRQALSVAKNPPIQKVIDSNERKTVKRIVSFLSGEDSVHSVELQWEAAWALTNIASGNSRHTQAVVDAGVIEPLVHLILNSRAEDVFDQCAWCLGNIAGDSVKFRNLLLESKTLPAILSLYDKPVINKTTRANATWAISNLCRHKPAPPYELVKPAIPYLVNLILSEEDDDILVDACWALTYMSDDNDNLPSLLQLLQEQKGLQGIVSLLDHKADAVKSAALRVMINIVSGSDDQTQMLLNYDLLSKLSTMICGSKEPIVANVAHIISNICAGTAEQIQHVFDAKLFGPLIALLEGATLYRKDVLWCVCNVIQKGTQDQVETLAQLDVIPQLCDIVQSDSKLAEIAIEGIEGLLMSNRLNNCKRLDECGGVISLKSLSGNSKQENVKLLVDRLLKLYF